MKTLAVVLTLFAAQSVRIRTCACLDCPGKGRCEDRPAKPAG